MRRGARGEDTLPLLLYSMTLKEISEAEALKQLPAHYYSTFNACTFNTGYSGVGYENDSESESESESECECENENEGERSCYRRSKLVTYLFLLSCCFAPFFYFITTGCYQRRSPSQLQKE